MDVLSAYHGIASGSPCVVPSRERELLLLLLLLLLLFIYLFIFAENSRGLVLLWMSELSLALACAVGYFDLRPFLSLVGESNKHDALIEDI